MKRIAVFVSGGGTNLQALMDAQAAGELGGGQIVLVLASNAKAYAIERAKQAGIPWVVVSKKACGSEEEFDARMIGPLREHHIDLVVLAGYLSYVSCSVLREYEGRILNIHPSLIPSFCGKGFYGLKVHQAVLAAGVKVTGATVHFVNEIYDGGAILLQRAVEVLPEDTPESLQLRVMQQAEWILLKQAVAAWCQGKIRLAEGKAWMTE